MKKPKLEDYSLNSKSIEVYKKQEEKYNQSWVKFCQARDSRNRIVNWFAYLPMIIFFILFLVFTYKLNNYNEGSEIVCILLLILSIAYPILVKKIFYIDDFPLSDFEKNKEKNFIETLPFKANKYDFVDEELEKNIQKYNNAVKKYEEYLIRLNVEFWQNLNGYQFENEVANLYRNLGLNAEVTKYAGDGGVDIILTDNFRKIAVQCKHHTSKVGPNDVRAFQSVVYNGEYDYGIFISLNGFTPTVAKEIEKSKIKILLMDINNLISLQESLK